MTKLPIQKLDQSGYVKTALRLPPELHVDLVLGAEVHGRSLNAEIIARLQMDQTAAVLAELADLKAMMRKLLDRT
jgi:hypothetical protein